MAVGEGGLELLAELSTAIVVSGDVFGDEVRAENESDDQDDHAERDHRDAVAAEDAPRALIETGGAPRDAL